MKYTITYIDGIAHWKNQKGKVFSSVKVHNWEYDSNNTPDCITQFHLAHPNDVELHTIKAKCFVCKKSHNMYHNESGPAYINRNWASYHEQWYYHGRAIAFIQGDV